MKGCASTTTLEDGRRYRCALPVHRTGDHVSCTTWPVATWPNGSDGAGSQLPLLGGEVS